MLDVKSIYFSRLHLGKFLYIFPAFLSSYCSPLHVTVFILLFFSGPSEAFLGVICSTPNQMEEETGKKMMCSMTF